MRAAMSLLPEMQHVAVMLHDIEGLTHQEVAAALGCHPVSCRTNVCRGRRHLRELLSEYVDRSG